MAAINAYYIPHALEKKLIAWSVSEVGQNFVFEKYMLI
jgi:hypothetical protein